MQVEPSETGAEIDTYAWRMMQFCEGELLSSDGRSASEPRCAWSRAQGNDIF